MTCYFRHLTKIFQETGIIITKENRHEIDEIIHEIVGVKYKNCPKTWVEVKRKIVTDEKGFVKTLKESYKRRLLLKI